MKILFLLFFLLSSCISGPQPIANLGPPWPLPPDPGGRVFLLREACEVPAGAVVMTPDFWQELVAYITEIEELRLRDLQVARGVYR